jgi:uncharacterized protein
MTISKSSKLVSRYGPWAVVTGASDGIGLELAKGLAQAGLNLVLIARRQEVLEKVAAQFQGDYKVQTRVLSADLANSKAVEEVMDATKDIKVGLLVASAGFGSSGEFLNTNLDTELAMIDVNCRAVLEMTHHYGKRFAAQKRGGIILLSSLVAFQGVPKSANYAATKAYIQSLVEGIHRELKVFGVDVLASAPGPVQTGFATRANMQMGAALTSSIVAKKTLEALGKKVTVRPGFSSFFLEASLSLLPRPARVNIMARVMESMTSHQASVGRGNRTSS